MVKAKDFWNCLCEELGYRFFAGVPCKGLDPLYKKMNPKFMHYVPAANEKIALGLVSGAYVAGLKGAVLMDSKFLLDLANYITDFNFEHEIPLLIIAYTEKDTEFPFRLPKTKLSKSSCLDYRKCLKSVDSRSERLGKPGIITIKGNILS
jgi:hypothetical protein